MTTPVNGPGGTPAPKKPDESEAMSRGSEKTKSVWKSAQPSVNTERSKVIIGAHKFTKGTAEATRKTDQRVTETRSKLQSKL
ncbi:MAG: hypothetical protein SNF33_01015 [Candidatus Algichlamydia australiensis]|nr:hypothetical protein [Chlamydiales bacterium]